MRVIDGKLVFKDAKLAKMNLSGEKSDNNPQGKRNFIAFIDDDDVAKELMEDGWNVKTIVSQQDGAESHFIPVEAKYDNFPPSISIISNGVETELGEDLVGEIDDLFYRHKPGFVVDRIKLVVTPYQWEVNGKSGIKAYVQMMKVYLDEDEVARALADEEAPEDE